MIVTRLFNDQVWTDLNSPTKEEVDSLVLAQNIDPAIAKDLLAPTPKQYAKKYGDSIYAVLHIPSFKHAHSESSAQEIDFVIKEKGLFTTRYDSIDAIFNFAKQIEVNEILNSEHSNQNHSHLFFSMMREIYTFLFDEIEYMKDWMKDIEKNIFDGQEKEMVFSISAAGRNLLNFKRVVGPHRAVLSNMESFGKEMFGEKFGKEARYLNEELEMLIGEIKSTSEMLDELRETNNSLLTTKQSETMKIFTILAFITFPLSLIASIFGMNTEHMPIVGAQNDFWIVIGLMICLSLVMFAFFKYKKWI